MYKGKICIELSVVFDLYSGLLLKYNRKFQWHANPYQTCTSSQVGFWSSIMWFNNGSCHIGNVVSTIPLVYLPLGLRWTFGLTAVTQISFTSSWANSPICYNTVTTVIAFQWLNGQFVANRRLCGLKAVPCCPEASGNQTNEKCWELLLRESELHGRAMKESGLEELNNKL